MWTGFIVCSAVSVGVDGVAKGAWWVQPLTLNKLLHNIQNILPSPQKKPTRHMLRVLDPVQ